MPNIGYTLDGYDIFFGNPIATGTEGATPDPGFRLQPIFKAVYSGKVTPDQRYSVPDGMEIRSCSGTCSMTFGSNLVSGTYVAPGPSKLEKVVNPGVHYQNQGPLPGAV